MRSQINVLCLRATTLMASTLGLSTETDRSWCEIGADHVGEDARIGGIVPGA
ncbi:hypothetical protein ACWEK5_49085 [Rhodococcus koreensis]